MVKTKGGMNRENLCWVSGMQAEIRTRCGLPNAGSQSSSPISVLLKARMPGVVRQQFRLNIWIQHVEKPIGP